MVDSRRQRAHLRKAGAHRVLLAVAFFATVAPCAMAAQRQDRRIGSTATARVFHIEPLPLHDALQEFARQSGVQIVFLSTVADGHNAPALSGTYEPNEALSRLLAGSGLTSREINARTLEVRQPANAEPATARVHDRPPRRAPSLTPHEPLEEVKIVATVENLVATRIPTPLREIPQSVSIVSGEQLRQQNQFDLTDVVARTPGIFGRQSNSLEPEFFARAFQLSPYQIDRGSSLEPRLSPEGTAYVASSPSFVGSPDLSEFDRIEVLRGSDALFAGNGRPGGTVSFVRKRPLAHARVALSAMLGSWNQRRIELDVTGPLTQDGTLRGRADAVYEDRDYFFETAHLERRKIFAVLEYDVTADSTLTTGASYQWDDARPLVLGWPWYGNGRNSHLPRNIGLTTQWASYRTEFGTAYLQYDTRIGNGWHFKLNAGFGLLRAEHAYAEFWGRIDPTTQRLETRPNAFFTARPATQHHKAADATLTGTPHWFGLRQELAIGADYSRSDLGGTSFTVRGFGPAVGDVREFDPSDYPDPRLAGTPTRFVDTLARFEQYGAFASLRTHIGDAWSVTLGARVGGDRVYLRIALPPLPVSASSEYGSTKAVTPLAAVMYRISDNYSWYASYADTYVTDVPHERADGETLRPTHAGTMETGLKGSWREGQLNGFLALYTIAQRSPTQDTAPRPKGSTSGCCWVRSLSRSYGVDIDLNGELARGWLIGSGYTYAQYRYAENRPQLESALSPKTPRHLMKLWTSVRLRGDLDRWTVGGTLRAQTAVDSGETTYCPSVPAGSGCSVVPVKMAGFLVLDLRSGYQVNPDWEVALSVNNALDKAYYESVHGPTGTAWYGAPRNFALRIDGRF